MVLLIFQEDSSSVRSFMDDFHNHCTHRDVEEVLIKILLLFGEVKFLVNGLVGLCMKVYEVVFVVENANYERVSSENLTND